MAVWLLTGIVIWIFWSAKVGSWLVIFGLIMGVVIPILKHRQSTHNDQAGFHD